MYVLVTVWKFILLCNLCNMFMKLIQRNSTQTKCFEKVLLCVTKYSCQTKQKKVHYFALCYK